MAVIRNGKIHGKIGKYVYRVVDGKEIVQSYPRQIKIAGNTKVENKRFAESSRMNARLYRLIKDSALAKTDGIFYSQLMSFVRSNFFSESAVNDDLSYSDWGLIPGSARVPINSNLRVEEVLKGFPAVEVLDGLCRVAVPAYEYRRRRNYFMQEAEYLEYSVSIVHYDFVLQQATALHDYDSGRFPKTYDVMGKVLEIPLEIDGKVVDKGLVIVCVGIRFFASKDSYGYLNTKECNPACMIGSWYKA